MTITRNPQILILIINSGPYIRVCIVSSSGGEAAYYSGLNLYLYYVGGS